MERATPAARATSARVMPANSHRRINAAGLIWRTRMRANLGSAKPTGGAPSPARALWRKRRQHGARRGDSAASIKANQRPPGIESSEQMRLGAREGARQMIGRQGPLL